MLACSLLNVAYCTHLLARLVFTIRCHREPRITLLVLFWVAAEAQLAPPEYPESPNDPRIRGVPQQRQAAPLRESTEYSGVARRGTAWHGVALVEFSTLELKSHCAHPMLPDSLIPNIKPSFSLPSSGRLRVPSTRQASMPH
jgi:hypothetical protein